MGALVGALGCGGGPSPGVDAAGQSSPSPASDRAPDAPPGAAADAGGAAGSSGSDGAAATGKAGKGECTDWSKTDLSLPPLPASPHAELFDTVWRRVLDKYYDPTIGCLDWPALRKKHGAKLQGAAPEQAHAAVRALLDELGRSHFALVAADAGDETAARGPASADLKLRWIDEQAVVVASGNKGVLPGSVVVSIEGQALAERVKLAVGDRSGSQAGHARLRALDSAVTGVAGQQLRVVLHKDGGGTVQRELRCELPEGERVSLGNLRDVSTEVEGHMLPDTKVGYLRFNVWMIPMLDRIRSSLAQMRSAGMTSLVLDLRGNPGGVGTMSVPLARMLLRDGGSLGQLRFRDFTQDLKVAGDPQAFDGPVAVLVDEGTASTSEIFVAGLRDLGRVQVVGAASTAGAALPSILERMPSGVLLQYAVGDYHSSKGTTVEGDGIAPDVMVEERRQDYVGGKDPVIEAAVRHLNGA